MSRLMLAVIFAALLVPALCLAQTPAETKAAPAATVAAVASTARNSGGFRFITDDELLALFPKDTPVGLATLSDGRKRLIFPHPGDEKRFVIHL